MEYDILKARTPVALVPLVLRAINAGWVPCGGVAVVDNEDSQVVMQAVTRTREAAQRNEFKEAKA